MSAKGSFNATALVFGFSFLSIAVIGIVSTYVLMPLSTILLIISATFIGASLVALAGMATASRRRSSQD